MQAKLKNSVYDDVKNDIKEIYSLLYITYEEIYDLIQIENSLNISNNLSIEIFIDNLSYEIIKYLNLFALKIYRKFLVELSQN